MTDFLLLAFIFLSAGVIAVPIATRLGLGSVLGYLIAGIALSPTLALLDVDVASIKTFAEFGVVMMLFLVGLELEPSKLWQMRGQLLGLGGGQVGLTAAAIMALCMAFGLDWNVALAVGLVLALSSTAIVLQTLNEKGLMKTDGGQASFSVLLFQDIAVIPMLALIPLLAVVGYDDVAQLTAGAPSEGGFSLVEGLNGWQTALVTLGAVAFVIVAGSYLTRPIFRFIAWANLRELFTAAALLMIVGIALLMGMVGVSAALGTFLAGVVLANSEYRHELESDIEPFKGLLLGLFFITVGASIDFGLFFENAPLILAMTAGLVAIKMIVLFSLNRMFKFKGTDGWLFTLSLAQAGEFGFVLLSPSVTGDVIPQQLSDQLLLVVAFSMLITPILFIFYERVIVPMSEQGQTREADTIEERSKVIIAGHGRVGGIINRMLRNAGLNPTVIDYSARQLDILRRFGVHVYFGDATRPDLLHSAGIDEAKILIVAIDDKHQITEIVKHAIHHHPHVHVIARAVDRHHVYELWAAGCRDIIRETFDSSLRMTRSAFEALGATREKAERIVEENVQYDRQSMIELASVYDLNIPAHENDAYVAKAREVFEESEPKLRARVLEIMAEDEVPAE